MERNTDRINRIKPVVGISGIALWGVVWIANSGKDVPVILFGSLIWIVLSYGVWRDWKAHRIHDAIPVSTGLLGIVYCMVTTQPPSYWGAGLLVNTTVMGIMYLASKRSVGLGDVKLLMALGIYLGPLAAFHLLFHASWISALTALAGIAFKRVKLCQELPFAPFIAAGYLLAISSL